MQTLFDTGFDSYFKTVLTGDDVTKGKPDPEIYVAAAAKMRVNTTNCVAFEDSVIGATAAIGAGMTVVLIPELVSLELEQMSPVIRFSTHAEAVELFP